MARILALFEPDTRKRYADYDGVAEKKWAALMALCDDNAIPVLSPNDLRDDEDLRDSAGARDLALLEDQLNNQELRRLYVGDAQQPPS